MMTAKTEYTYFCRRLEDQTESGWELVPGVNLVETLNGGQPRLHTVLKACWTDEHVRFRFECEDDHQVARFAERDDPLYDEDVVEIFIDQAGDGRHYMEFELSPRNVLFDALVENDLAGTIKVDTSWDAAGIRTQARRVGENRYVYEIDMPHAIFAAKPAPGTTWRVNFYRIDDDREGVRHYWAWSPTGAIQYHLPRQFGQLIFE